MQKVAYALQLPTPREVPKVIHFWYCIWSTYCLDMRRPTTLTIYRHDQVAVSGSSVRDVRRTKFLQISFPSSAARSSQVTRLVPRRSAEHTIGRGSQPSASFLVEGPNIRFRFRLLSVESSAPQLLTDYLQTPRSIFALTDRLPPEQTIRYNP